MHGHETHDRRTSSERGLVLVRSGHWRVGRTAGAGLALGRRWDVGRAGGGEGDVPTGAAAGGEGQGLSAASVAERSASDPESRTTEILSASTSDGEALREEPRGGGDGGSASGVKARGTAAGGTGSAAWGAAGRERLAMALVRVPEGWVVAARGVGAEPP